ncbi:MAG: hypothetical protein LBU91_01650 [Bacteroidales bacterium]|jgi:hypothetical protein|nr:hypothetical protein [Bacteroidales bacterium]
MKKLLLFVSLFAVVSVSCIKKEYDLTKDNLDLTIRVDSDIAIPVGTTDSLFLRDFLNVDQIDMMDTLNGGYAFNYAGEENIEVPDIDMSDLNIDDFQLEQFRHEMDFAEYADEITNFSMPEIELSTEVNSGFYLPDDIVLDIQTALPYPPLNGSISLEDLKDNPILSGNELPLSAVKDTAIEVSIDVDLGSNASFIKKVDTVWLDDDNLTINVDIDNVPDGINVTLDSLLLVFPTEIKLTEGLANVVSASTYCVKDEELTGVASTPLSIPVKCLTGIPIEGGHLKLDKEIRVLAKYSLGGAYSGGFFPSNEDESTRLSLDMTSSLAFKSAAITLDMDALQGDLALEPQLFPVEFEVEIPDEVTIVTVDSILLNNTQINLELNLESLGLNSSLVDNLNIDVNIEFPSVIMFDSPDIDENNKFEDRITFDNGVWTKTFNVRGFKLDPSMFANNMLKIEDNISVEANISLENPTINTATLLDTELRITVDGGVENIDLRRIYAKIDFDVPSDPISLDLSEFLEIEMIKNNRDSIVLDVNPYLDLKLNTNLQVPLSAGVVLTPYKGGVAQTPEEIILDVPASLGEMTETKFWIAKDNSLMPEGYTFVEGDLVAVVKSLPDSIQIEVQGGVDSDETVIFDFNTQYAADLSYNFVLPLSFGEQFQIVIQDTMENMFDSIIGTMLNGNTVALDIYVLNDIPLDLTATVIPIDIDNKPIAGVKPAVLDIKAGAKIDDDPSRIEFDDSDTKGHGLVNMRGVIWHFKVKTGTNMQGVALKPDNFIQVKVKAELHGGATIDLNDLLDDNDNSNDQ